MTGIEQLPNQQWVVTGDTHLGTWAKEHGSIITDPYLFKFLKPHLAEAKVVWDIGANIGDHARQYLDWGMTVVAVEPNPVAFKCLAHNCPEATCLDLAAASSDGVLRFDPLANVGASRIAENGAVTVEARALDHVAGLPDPDFVKIDVEGWEVDALNGMLATLTRCKPVIYIEVNRGALAANGKQPEDILWILKGLLGYNHFTHYPSGVRWEDPQFDILAKHLPQ
jgi:FkbM family methyltransferase